MSGGTNQMDGASWAVLIIVIILIVLLSTICSWFNSLILAIGRTLAWTIVSIIIAILIISLLVILCTNPDAFNRIIDLICTSTETIGSSVNKILNETLDTGISILGKHLGKIVGITAIGIGLYLGVKYVQKKNLYE